MTLMFWRAFQFAQLPPLGAFFPLFWNQDMKQKVAKLFEFVKMGEKVEVFILNAMLSNCNETDIFLAKVMAIRGTIKKVLGLTMF